MMQEILLHTDFFQKRKVDFGLQPRCHFNVSRIPGWILKCVQLNKYVIEVLTYIQNYKFYVKKNSWFDICDKISNKEKGIGCNTYHRHKSRKML